MGDNYYSYKNESFSCIHCGWKGPGSKVIQGEMFEAGFEVDCPECHQRFPGLILFPKVEDALEMGPEEDKLYAAALASHREKWLSSSLKDTSQLPDLDDSFMTFILREVAGNREKFIVVTYKERVIWQEILAYEYYDRFIALGNLFRKKYGSKLIDLVPDVDGIYLYGDSPTAAGLIAHFRESLRNNNADYL